MGSWGYKLFDDDQAMDFFDELSRSNDATAIIKAVLKGGEDGEARAAAHFLCLIRKYIINPSLYEQHVKEAIGQLEALLKDKDYTENWDYPAAIKKEIRKELVALKKSVK